MIVGIESGSYYALAPYVSGNNCKRNEIPTPVSGSFTSDVAALTLGGISGNWTLYDGAKYLYAAGGTGSNNYLKGTTTATALNAQWTISINSENGVATIVTADTTVARNKIRNNNSNDCFSCYNSGQADVYIYKKTGGETSLQKAQKYAVTLSNSIVCYSGEQTPSISGTTWASLATAYSALSSEVKAIFVAADYTVSGTEVTPIGETDQVVANAVAKYDQLVVRYSSTYNNFMDRELASLRNPASQIIEGINAQTIVIIVSSLLGVTAIAGYVFYRKRKEQ